MNAMNARPYRVIAPQPSTSPVTAIPSPSCPVCRISRRAAWPRITAGIAVSPMVGISRSPHTSAATAVLFVVRGLAAADTEVPDGTAGTGPCGRSPVIAAKSAYVRAAYTRATRSSCSSLVSRPSAKPARSTSTARSRSALDALRPS
jgi:hypothetical protein